VELFPPRRPTRRTQRFFPVRRNLSTRERHQGDVAGKPAATRALSIASKRSRNAFTQSGGPWGASGGQTASAGRIGAGDLRRAKAMDGSTVAKTFGE
jgi:hypothetical protein